jgi:excisionase family DNA binding protein
MLPVADDLTPSEVAARCRVPVLTVHAWCRRRDLAGAYKVGRFWRVPLAALEAFCTMPPDPPGRRQRRPRAGEAEARARATHEQLRKLGMVP